MESPMGRGVPEGRGGPGVYLYRERAADEVLPWEHLDFGLDRRGEYERAMEEEVLPDCREGTPHRVRCLRCHGGRDGFERW